MTNQALAGWGEERSTSWDETINHERRRRKSSSAKPAQPVVVGGAPTREDWAYGIWFQADLEDHDATSNLDNQHPATLFYLGRILKDVPEVSEVLVSKSDRGKIKHWTVLDERDYGIMDQIYDLEADTLRRFPHSDIDFRVTVDPTEGDTTDIEATKIFGK